MHNIPLKEWAKREEISRRKAEYLAKDPAFPAVKEKRTFTRQVWVTVVPEDFTLAEFVKSKSQDSLARKERRE